MRLSASEVSAVKRIVTDQRDGARTSVNRQPHVARQDHTLAAGQPVSRSGGANVGLGTAGHVKFELRLGIRRSHTHRPMAAARHPDSGDELTARSWLLMKLLPREAAADPSFTERVITTTRVT